MALVGKAEIGRDGRNSFSRSKAITRFIQPLDECVGAGRHTESTREAPDVTLAGKPSAQRDLIGGVPKRPGGRRRIGFRRPFELIENGREQCLRFGHANPQFQLRCRQNAGRQPDRRQRCIDIEASRVVIRRWQASMNNACWNMEALASLDAKLLVADPENTTPRQDERQLILGMEMSTECRRCAASPYCTFDGFVVPPIGPSPPYRRSTHIRPSRRATCNGPRQSVQAQAISTRQSRAI